MGIVTSATVSLQSILGGETGLAWALSESDPVIGGGKVGEIRVENVALDVAEKSSVRYPSFAVYCDKFTNTQREKFSAVSGTLSMVLRSDLRGTRSRPCRSRPPSAQKP